METISIALSSSSDVKTISCRSELVVPAALMLVMTVYSVVGVETSETKNTTRVKHLSYRPNGPMKRRNRIFRREWRLQMRDQRPPTGTTKPGAIGPPGSGVPCSLFGKKQTVEPLCLPRPYENTWDGQKPQRASCVIFPSSGAISAIE